MIARESDGVWITMRETVSAHPEDVFAALTTSDGLTRWFPVAAEVDLRSGGSIVLGWDRKFKRKLTIGIDAFDPGGKVTWRWPGRLGEHDVRAEWSVTPSTEEGSLVVLRMGPFDEDPESLIAMAEDAESWRWYLCNLRTVLEARVDMRAERPL